MADQSQIIIGSFKGVQIAIDSSDLSGGRRKSIKRFPSRDTQNVEDLGAIPRKFTLNIVVAAQPNESYFSYRDRLLDAVSGSESGVLIHPLYGRIEDVVSIDFNLNENFGSFGDTVLNVNFEIDQNSGIPQQSRNVITEIVSQADIVNSAISQDLQDNYSVTQAFPDSFSQAIDKVDSFFDRVSGELTVIGTVADEINSLNSLISRATDNIISIATEPLNLFDSIQGLLTGINSISPTAEASLSAYTRFFDFGDDDVQTRENTASLIERSRNNGIVNGAVAAITLSQAYISISRIEFQTERQILTLRGSLDDQFTKVVEGGSSQEVKDAIVAMRVSVFDFLEERRLNASRIIEISTRETSARLIGFNYYGDDTHGDEIIELNELTDGVFVEGVIEVVTA